MAIALFIGTLVGAIAGCAFTYYLWAMRQDDEVLSR